MNKNILLASFILKDKVNSIKSHLKNNFDINEDKVFVYSIENNPNYLITFKIEVEKGERLDIKKHFRNTILIHKKSSTLYTINALNIIIESENESLDASTINHKDIKIKWENYPNKLLMVNDKKLITYSITRIFP